MLTNKSFTDFLFIFSLIISLLHESNAFDVRQREDNDRYNDVRYNEVDSNGADSTAEDQRPSHLEFVSKHFTQWSRTVFTEELGVTNMQQMYDTLNAVKHDINFETVIEDMTQKVCLSSISIIMILRHSLSE